MACKQTEQRHTQQVEKAARARHDLFVLLQKAARRFPLLKTEHDPFAANQSNGKNILILFSDLVYW